MVLNVYSSQAKYLPIEQNGHHLYHKKKIDISLFKVLKRTLIFKRAENPLANVAIRVL